MEFQDSIPKSADWVYDSFVRAGKVSQRTERNQPQRPQSWSTWCSLWFVVTFVTPNLTMQNCCTPCALKMEVQTELKLCCTEDGGRWEKKSNLTLRRRPYRGSLQTALRCWHCKELVLNVREKVA